MRGLLNLTTTNLTIDAAGNLTTNLLKLTTEANTIGSNTTRSHNKNSSSTEVKVLAFLTICTLIISVSIAVRCTKKYFAARDQAHQLLMKEMEDYEALVTRQGNELNEINQAINICRNEFEAAIREQEHKCEQLLTVPVDHVRLVGNSQHRARRSSNMSPERLDLYRQLVKALKEYPELSANNRPTLQEIRQINKDRATHHDHVKEIAVKLLGESYRFLQQPYASYQASSH